MPFSPDSSTIAGVEHLSFDASPTTPDAASLLVVQTARPVSCCVTSPRGTLKGQAATTLYVRFRHLSSPSVPAARPVLIHYRQGAFGRGKVTNGQVHFAEASYLNNAMTNQLGSYLLQLLQQPTIDYALLEHLLCLLMTCLLELYDEVKDPDDYRTGGLTPRQLRTIDEYIQQSIDQPISLHDLSGQLALSTYHFCRMFKRCTGESPVAYVTKKKMDCARRLLGETNLPVIQVSLEVGYDNPGHFATIFRKAFGQSPTGWRRQQMTA